MALSHWPLIIFFVALFGIANSNGLIHYAKAKLLCLEKRQKNLKATNALSYYAKYNDTPNKEFAHLVSLFFDACEKTNIESNFTPKRTFLAFGTFSALAIANDLLMPYLGQSLVQTVTQIIRHYQHDYNQYLREDRQWNFMFDIHDLAKFVYL